MCGCKSADTLSLRAALPTCAGTASALEPMLFSFFVVSTGSLGQASAQPFRQACTFEAQLALATMPQRLKHLPCDSGQRKMACTMCPQCPTGMQLLTWSMPPASTAGSLSPRSSSAPTRKKPRRLRAVMRPSSLNPTSYCTSVSSRPAGAQGFCCAWHAEGAACTLLAGLIRVSGWSRSALWMQGLAVLAGSLGMLTLCQALCCRCRRQVL